MTLSIYPASDEFAAEIADVAVLIFPQQQLEASQHLAFATQFGPLERTVEQATHRQQYRVDRQFQRATTSDRPEAFVQA